MISHAEVNFTHHGSLYVTDGAVESLSLYLHIPQNTLTKKVSITTPFDHSFVDINGTKFLRINAIGPMSSFSYSFSGTVFSDYDYPYDSHISSYDYYLHSTGHIIVDSNVRSLASNITEGLTSDIERIYSLAEWVHDYIEYTPTLSNVNRPSSELLDDPRGVCTEYTNLFVALSRALGYPTRVVIGYVYVPEEGWMFHSWAEVYADKWIGVDPTWLEVGYIDALHIPLEYSVDTEFKDRVVADMIERGDLVWSSSSYLGESIGGFKIVDYEEDPIEYDVSVEPSKLDPGDTGYIIIYAHSEVYRVAKFPVVVCDGTPWIIKSNLSEVTWLLKPGLNSMYISFKVNPSLESNYIYQCPVYVAGETLNLSVDTSLVNHTRGITVYSSILNTSSALVVESNISMVLHVYPQKGFGYSLPVENSVVIDEDGWVVLSDGDSAKLVSNDNSVVSNPIACVPTVAYVGVPISVMYSGIMNGSGWLFLYDNDFLVYRTPLSDSFNITFPYVFNTSGHHYLKFVFSEGGSADIRTFPVMVYSSNFTVDYGCSFIGPCSLEVIVPRGISKYVILVDGKLTDGSTNVGEGPHDVMIKWYDQNGNSYVHSLTVNVKSNNSIVLIVGSLLLIALIFKLLR